MSYISSVKEHEGWTVTGTRDMQNREARAHGLRERETTVLEELKHMHIIRNYQCLVLQDQTAWVDLELLHFYAFSITKILILHYIWLVQVFKLQQHFKINFPY